MVFDRKVLRRQTEGVKADGVEHVVALHALFARDDVHRGEGAGMTDVQTGSGGIRELDQTVKLRLTAARDGGVGLGLFPIRLPFLFNGFKIVLHSILLYVK